MTVQLLLSFRLSFPLTLGVGQHILGMIVSWVA
jgi:hypothetical protein